MKSRAEHPRTVGQFQKVQCIIVRIPEKEKEWSRKIFEVVMSTHFSKILTVTKSQIQEA